jgi:hypothetical protein
MKIQFRRFDGPTDWGFIQSQAPILRVEDTTGIMAIDEETNTTVGAAIMDNWTHNSVQMHFIVTNSMVLRHGFMEEIFDFIFNVKKLSYIYGMVRETNEKALKIDAHMGFVEVLRLPDAWAVGEDILVVELKKENCQYLPQQGILSPDTGVAA